MTGMYAVFSFLIGASLTSFFGVLGSRLPQGESINGRSVCDHCQSVLSAHALIPILGYLLMRGRCGRCRQRVSSKYPLFELLGGGLFVVGYLAQPFFDVRLLAYFVFVSVMLVGVFSAMAFYELPWQVWGLGLVTLAAIQVVAPTLARWDSTVALVLVAIMVGLYHRFQSRVLDK
ncbi:MAG: prepilin peptidase, partial [Acholeplasmatales bacterium]